jgi:hypothetical protein
VDEEEDDDVSGNGGTREATGMDAKMTTKTKNGASGSARKVVVEMHGKENEPVMSFHRDKNVENYAGKLHKEVWRSKATQKQEKHM